MTDKAIIEDCHQIISTCKTLTLATANEIGSHSSYAPYIYSDCKFYILVSGLAEHTSNLINAETKIGCMLIEDEAKSKQIFARKRLMFKSIPVQINRNSTDWDRVIELFNSRFGDIIELLDSLPDFVLFELKPEQAILVKGFGDAHQLSDVFS